jgi:hypothetical protein
MEISDVRRQSRGISYPKDQRRDRPFLHKRQIFPPTSSARAGKFLRHPFFSAERLALLPAVAPAGKIAAGHSLLRGTEPLLSVESPGMAL